MQIIISPAKQMAVRNDSFEPRGIPSFPRETEYILHALQAIEKEKGPQGLQGLWSVSDKLLNENIERLHTFRHVSSADQLSEPSVSRLVCPALFSYIGIQYRSMAPAVLDGRALEWLQSHLWILSGLYGCLRPFDAVQPYRLEMGAKLNIGESQGLYAFWGDRVANEVRESAQEDCVLVNLASAEYAKAVLPHLDERTHVVTCVFSSTVHNGKPVQKSTESKAARGSMVRWMAEREISSVEELRGFDVGFHYDASLSIDKGSHQKIVFVRGPVHSASSPQTSPRGI